MALPVGQQMVRFLMKNLGHCYSLGGDWPNCSDCSGTTEHVYAKFANVHLPHYTVTQFELLGGKVGAFPKLTPGKNRLGEIFTDERMAEQGDLVFRSYKGFAKAGDNPDHVGTYKAKGLMVDMRSQSEPLAVRSIYDGQAGSQTLFGRVYSVNGPVQLPKPPVPKVPSRLTLRIRRVRAAILHHHPHLTRLNRLLRKLLKRRSGTG